MSARRQVGWREECGVPHPSHARPDKLVDFRLPRSARSLSDESCVRRVHAHRRSRTHQLHSPRAFFSLAAARCRRQEGHWDFRQVFFASFGVGGGGVQGGRLALGPFSYLKTRNGPRFWPPFRSEWGLFGRSGTSKFRRGTLISITFLGLRVISTSKCEHSENHLKTPSGWTKNACCLRHLVSRICFSPKEKRTL